MGRKTHNETSKKEEILGIMLMAFAVLVFISLLTYKSFEQPDNITMGSIQNRLGIAGVYISYFLINYVIGYPSFVFPVILFISGWSLFRAYDFSRAFRGITYLLIFAIYTSVILAIPQVTSPDTSDFDSSFSGLVGWFIAKMLFDYLGIAGSIVVLLSLIMITVVGATNLSFSGIMTNIGIFFSTTTAWTKNKFNDIMERPKASKSDRSAKSLNRKIKIPEKFATRKDAGSDKPKRKIPEIRAKQMEIELENESAGVSSSKEETPDFFDPAETGRYIFPVLNYLNYNANSGSRLTNEELNRNAQILEERLLEFGVQGKIVEINPGPIITRYEVEPAPGIKISKIAGLADDLALAMRAKSIRIVAPIPGKGVVGIELPNPVPATVYLREILQSPEFQKSTSPLTLALGKTISGKPYVADLDQMPHLLIAGATGSGKSVCINTIIASILYKAHPTKVQFVMIDPKRLELGIYRDLRHHHLNFREDLDEEVVTTPQNAISVLKSIEAVMDNRYDILAQAGVRDIAEYNQKLKTGQLKNIEPEEPFKPLEYLVLIVDELADLMLTAAKEVEPPILRLTAMARAVGIHLILATQRPSVDVITGVIKANFPARIAFKVAQKTDSRTILDLNGAERLLGAGDMLFIPPGSATPVRIHGAFISIGEIEKIIGHIRKQPKYPKQKLPSHPDEAAGSIDNGPFEGSKDALFHDALRLVVTHQQGSISLLQRRLKVGYARAARLIDELEAAGVVGPYDGSKAREVLVDEMQLEDLDFS